MLTTVDPLDIVNGAGIAERMGVGRPAVSMWRKRHKSFPAPLTMPGVVGIPLYSWREVGAWHERHHRQPAGACSICRRVFADTYTR